MYTTNVGTDNTGVTCQREDWVFSIHLKISEDQMNTFLSPTGVFGLTQLLRHSVTCGKWFAWTTSPPAFTKHLSFKLLQLERNPATRGSPNMPWQHCSYISAPKSCCKSNPNCSTAENTYWDVSKFHPLSCCGKVGREPFKNVVSVLCKETNQEVEVGERPGRARTARSNYKSTYYKSAFPRLMGERTKWFWHAKTS